jgi:hypothetical protein
MAIDVKRAVELARHYLSDIIQVPTSDTLLEEVERSSDGRSWLITLSYPLRFRSPVEAIVARSDRDYKVVKLLADTGDFESIKIRDLARV